MRGKRSLSTEYLFPELYKTPEAEVTKLLRRGRDPQLIERRNKLLAARFYFYSIIQEKKFEPIMLQLSQEFHLNELRIHNCLKTQLVYIKELKANNTTASDLKKLYPWLLWS